MDTPPAPRRRTRKQIVAVLPSFNTLQQMDVFQAANAHIFPSVLSLRWFYRQHRSELLNAGAIVELTGRLLVDAPIFAQKAVEIGRRAAAARHAVGNQP